MRTLLLATILVGCGTSNTLPVFCTTPCGLSIAAANRVPQFPCEAYVAMEAAMLQDSAVLPHSCDTWRGAVAWEMPGQNSVLSGVRVAGWTECFNRRFMFHTGDGVLQIGESSISRAAWDTAYVHEATHLAQRCASSPPIDEGADESLSDWHRLDLYNMPSRVRLRLVRP